jgi:hypothetical protein
MHGTAPALSRPSELAAKLGTHIDAPNFSPQSVTFISTNDGWALGGVPCPPVSTCLAVYRTLNGGRTWSKVPLPKAILNVANRDVQGTMAANSSMYGLQIRYANVEDGWIYGALEQPIRQNGVSYLRLVPRLWSTHDGGLMWRRQPLPWMAGQDEFFDLETAHGTVYALAPNHKNAVTVESSPVGVDQWRSDTQVRFATPAGGGQLTGSIVLQGVKGWIVEGNDRGVTGSAQLSSAGTWVPWTPPCSKVGDSYYVPSVTSTGELVTICSIGGYGGGATKSDPPGAALGSGWLYFSTNGGASFQAGLELRPVRAFLNIGALAAPSPHVVLLGRFTNGGGILSASFDGGVQWATVYHGTVDFLGFTSATQGVAIIGGPRTTMIMTYDGGHLWQKVTF